MRRRANLYVTAVLIGLLAACAHPLLTPDERKQVCQGIVDEKFGAPVFQPNVFSSPAGGLVGAGTGALAGLQASGGTFAALVTVPIGAAIGAVGGTACAAASMAHSTADADFADLLRAADAGALTRTVESTLNAPRADCSPAPGAGANTTEPDSVIEIEKIHAGMGCLLGRMEYWVAVDWRTVSLRSWKVLNSTATRCTVTSFRDVDAWFAHRGRAQAEIEGVLAAIGRRMVLQLLAEDVYSVECKLASDEAGEVKAR
jgi:hypothetical protein